MFTSTTWTWRHHLRVDQNFSPQPVPSGLGGLGHIIPPVCFRSALSAPSGVSTGGHSGYPRLKLYFAIPIPKNKQTDKRALIMLECHPN